MCTYPPGIFCPAIKKQINILLKIQDSDVATDFQAALDTPAGRRRPQATPKKAVAPSGEDDAEDGAADDRGDSGEKEDDEDEDEGWGDDEF